MTDESANISLVVDENLCHSCGACAGVCPRNAISFEETAAGFPWPVVDARECDSCGLCLEVCPGRSLGATLREILREDPFTGRALGSFVGRSSDDGVHAGSQSGGVASELLIHALRSGKISGAVVVEMIPGPRPRPAARLVFTEEEILSARGSKYSPVPILELIGDILGADGQVAVVGLSCHIHGLAGAFGILPGLEEKVAFRIGLVCDRSISAASIDYLARKAGFGDGEEKTIVFRDKSRGGYPGNVRVSSPDGRSVTLSDGNRKRLKPYLTSPRCHLCFDKMNVLADVTVGDPHGIASADRRNGESICIPRTEAGLALVESAVESGRISLREVPYSLVVRGQMIEKKKSSWLGFLARWRSLGRPTPDYCAPVEEHAGGVAADRDGAVRNALALMSFDDREELLAWIGRRERKDLLLGALKSVYAYPLAAARRLLSAARRPGKSRRERTGREC